MNATRTRRHVDLPADDWSVITRGWSNGHLPCTDSPAWDALPNDDPIKAAAAAAERLGVRELVNLHGPTSARAKKQEHAPR